MKEPIYVENKPENRQQAEFFSPKLRQADQETDSRAELLEKTMRGERHFLDREELEEYKDLAGDDDFVTLKDLFEAARQAGQEGNRAALKALKGLGQSLLHGKYLWQGSHDAQAGEWNDHMTSDDRLVVRAAEMIILKAEMEFLRLRSKEGTLGEIPDDKLNWLLNQFRRYARNVDIPPEFRRDLLGIIQEVKPRQKAQAAPVMRQRSPQEQFEEDALRAADVLAEQARAGGDTTLALGNALEETVVETKKPKAVETEVEQVGNEPALSVPHSKHQPKGFWQMVGTGLQNEVRQHWLSSAGWVLVGGLAIWGGPLGILGGLAAGGLAYYTRKKLEPQWAEESAKLAAAEPKKQTSPSWFERAEDVVMDWWDGFQEWRVKRRERRSQPTSQEKAPVSHVFDIDKWGMLAESKVVTEGEHYENSSGEVEFVVVAIDEAAEEVVVRFVKAFWILTDKDQNFRMSFEDFINNYLNIYKRKEDL